MYIGLRLPYRCGSDLGMLPQYGQLIVLQSEFDLFISEQPIELDLLSRSSSNICESSMSFVPSPIIWNCPLRAGRLLKQQQYDITIVVFGSIMLHHLNTCLKLQPCAVAMSSVHTIGLFTIRTMIFFSSRLCILTD